MECYQVRFQIEFIFPDPKKLGAYLIANLLILNVLIFILMPV
jgi:hypothetical protein